MIRHYHEMPEAKRAAVVQQLPELLPATVVMRFRDYELDLLSQASGTEEYWTVLSRILARIDEEMER